VLTECFRILYDRVQICSMYTFDWLVLCVKALCVDGIGIVFQLYIPYVGIYAHCLSNRSLVLCQRVFVICWVGVMTNSVIEISLNLYLRKRDKAIYADRLW